MTTQTTTSLISTALYRLGVVAIEQPVENSFIQRGLIALNDVIDEWGGSGIYIPYQSLLSVPLVYNQEAYTVGPDPSYSLNTSQIIELLEITIQDSQAPGVDYVVNAITEQMYRNIPYKLAQGIPRCILLRNVVDHSFLHFQPVPYAVMTASILCKQRLSEFLINQQMSTIPNHYLLALKYNLQNHLAQEFGKTLDQGFMMRLKEANENLLSSNFGVDWGTKKDEILNDMVNNYYSWYV